MSAAPEAGQSASSLAEPEGAVSQSIGIALRALQLALLALVALWVAGNVRRVPSDQQALILRFGRVAGVQQSGLVYTWPRPFEEVQLLPGPTLRQGTSVDTTHRDIRVVPPFSLVSRSNRIPGNAGAFLTGDGGIIILQAWLSWHVTDPAAFYLARSRIEPALQRLFAAAATAIAASHELDDFLAVRPERASDPVAQSRRQAIRGELADAVNARLRALQAPDGGLGVEITRVDLTPMLPPSAKDAFDQVLLSAQIAEQNVADARTQALTTAQAAEQGRDATIARSRATAAERVANARTRTAAIVALRDQAGTTNRPSVLEQIYRERISKVLSQAGGVSAVDLSGGAHVIVSGAPSVGTAPVAGPPGSNPFGVPR